MPDPGCELCPCTASENYPTTSYVMLQQLSIVLKRMDMVISHERRSGQVCKSWERLFRVFPESENKLWEKRYMLETTLQRIVSPTSTSMFFALWTPVIAG